MVDQGSAQRIASVSRGGGDPTGLRVRLLEEFARAIRFDAYAFVLTDPETTVGSAPLADVPCLAELPRLIRLKYLTTVNRWTALDGVGRLRQATGGERERSLLWRELLSRYDVGDVASMVFADRYGCWGFLDLWRLGTDAEFSAAEARFLASVSGTVTTALRRAQADTFAAAAPPSMRSGPVVLLLSADLDVLGQTPSTREYLRVLVPTAGEPIPAAAYNVGAQLLANRAGVDAHPASARVHLSDGRWLTLRAATIGADHTVAVSIEDSSPADRLRVFARAHGLSERERDLLRHLAGGSDTRDVARLMHLSEHTVQDHLKSVFDKTATRSRRSLLSRAIGT
jgi:DNA-binding CsgD family transcriptional regulator